MSSQYPNKIKIIRRALLIIIGFGILTIIFIFLNSIVNNYARMAAFDHLCRNERPRANLDTWSISPKAVLQTFPQSQTVFGTVEHKIKFISDILGLRSVKLYVARLAGQYADDKDLEALARFPELEYLEVINANVTKDGLNKFRKALPDCEINYKGATNDL